MFFSDILTILLVCVCVAQCTVTPSCMTSPRGYGFHACPPDLGLTLTPVKQVSVNDEAECARECLKHPDCKSVNVRLESPLSTPRDCQLFTQQADCGDLNQVPGYRHYKTMESFHMCIIRGKEVRGAAFIGDNNYILFFETTMQKFQLTGQSLHPVECPVQLTDYFFGWPGLPQAVVYSKAVILYGALYVVKDGTVHQYTMSSTNAFPSMFAPWPQSVSDFFGAGVPDDLTAAFAQQDRFYLCTANNLYVSENQTVVDVTSGYTSPNFGWSDVTAAAMDTDTDVAILFTGSTYFLYDVTGGTTIGSGVVCTNL